MSHRLRCIVPGCRRTIKVQYEPGDGDEGLCSKHWPLAPLAWRHTYQRLRRRLRKIVARGVVGKPTAEGWWAAMPWDRQSRNELWVRYDESQMFLAHMRLLDSLRRCWAKLRTAAIEKAMGI